MACSRTASGKKEAPLQEASGAADRRVEDYIRLLETSWPKGAPFPPAAPWVASMTRRSTIEKEIRRRAGILPDLLPGGTPETDHQNLVTISEFAGQVLGDPSVLYSGCGKTDYTGEFGHDRYQDAGCHGNAGWANECIPLVGDYAEPYRTGHCDYPCGQVTEWSDCTYDVECCGETDC